jgi:CheY-like chemotaxis protein
MHPSNQNEQPPAQILLVEDDALLAEMVKIQLEKRNFKLCVAKNGRQAVQTIKEFAPDLLITDIFMDEMDGLELLTHLKKHRPEIKIIAMSGQLDDATTSFLAIAKALGAHRILSKPFDLPTLLNLISDLLLEPTGQVSK